MATKYRVRCRNSKCRHRRTSKVHPLDYVIVPKCTACGGSHGWREEKRLWSLNTCNCAGVPYPHQYKTHPKCHDRAIMVMKIRQFMPQPCELYVCDGTCDRGLMDVYRVGDYLAYVAAHDAAEAIKVLEHNYPQAHGLLLTAIDVQLEPVFRTVQAYDYADTTTEKPPLSSLWDLWVEAMTPRVLSVNSTIKGLISDEQQEPSNSDEAPF